MHAQEDLASIDVINLQHDTNVANSIDGACDEYIAFTLTIKRACRFVYWLLCIR